MSLRIRGWFCVATALALAGSAAGHVNDRQIAPSLPDVVDRVSPVLAKETGPGHLFVVLLDGKPAPARVEAKTAFLDGVGPGRHLVAIP